ncbi:MAG: WYL domain-containing protein [Eggerthellaceae bacterium]|nr:WYL domain-containing protein [Eggerthellaceae bacterium]
MDEMMTTEEMAEMLPGSLGLQDDARSRLLCTLGILMQFTDSNHGLTATEIRDILASRSESGKRPSEPSVLSDIKSLAENGMPAIEIERPTRGKTDGFRCTKAFLTDAQARLLINIVRTCKFITLDEWRHLCETLEGLVSVDQQDRSVGEVYVDERPRPTEPDVYEAADVATQSIELGRKMGFGYCYHGLDGKEHLLEAPGGGFEFHETPIALIFSNGNYYLETWPEHPSESLPRKHFSRRLDRIRNPRVLDAKAEKNDEIESLKRSVPRRISQTFDMYGDGVERHLFLKVSANVSNSVLARFGHACKFENVAMEEDGVKYGYLLVSVQLSPTFYRWIFGFGSQIQIVRPVNELWIRGGTWAKHPASKRTFNSLVEDYEAAVDGYVAHLKEALSPYEV